MMVACDWEDIRWIGPGKAEAGIHGSTVHF